MMLLIVVLTRVGVFQSSNVLFVSEMVFSYSLDTSGCPAVVPGNYFNCGWEKARKPRIFQISDVTLLQSGLRRDTDIYWMDLMKTICNYWSIKGLISAIIRGRVGDIEMLRDFKYVRSRGERRSRVFTVQGSVMSWNFQKKTWLFLPLVIYRLKKQT